jgi:hypothetical protein
MRWLGHVDKARQLLEIRVLTHDAAEFKGGLRDNWPLPVAHYEMAVVAWIEAGGEGGSKPELEDCSRSLEKAASWEAYDLDSRYVWVFPFSFSFALFFFPSLSPFSYPLPFQKQNTPFYYSTHTSHTSQTCRCATTLNQHGRSRQPGFQNTPPPASLTHLSHSNPSFPSLHSLFWCNSCFYSFFFFSPSISCAWLISVSTKKQNRSQSDYCKGNAQEMRRHCCRCLKKREKKKSIRVIQIFVTVIR